MSGAAVLDAPARPAARWLPWRGRPIPEWLVVLCRAGTCSGSLAGSTALVLLQAGVVGDRSAHQAPFGRCDGR